MVVTIDKQHIKILSCLKQDSLSYYLIEYQADKTLTYRNGDNIWITDTENMQFIATIRNVKDYTAEIYMSKQYENTIIGDITTWLLFSPSISIEGASEIIELTKGFPPCHYENILSFTETENRLLFHISLETYNRIMELCLSNISENKLVDYEEMNTILQLDFSYCENGIKVNIDSIEGLNGTVVCENIEARLI